MVEGGIEGGILFGAELCVSHGFGAMRFPGREALVLPQLPYRRAGGGTDPYLPRADESGAVIASSLGIETLEVLVPVFEAPRDRCHEAMLIDHV